MNDWDRIMEEDWEMILSRLNWINRTIALPYIWIGDSYDLTKIIIWISFDDEDSNEDLIVEDLDESISKWYEKYSARYDQYMQFLQDNPQPDYEEIRKISDAYDPWKENRMSVEGLIIQEIRLNMIIEQPWRFFNEKIYI